jgi:hypothetical protein
LFQSVLLVAIILLPIQLVYILKENSRNLTIIDKSMILLLLSIAIIPDFYLYHVLIVLGVYFIWLATNNRLFSNKIKLFPVIPMISILIWLAIPYLSIFFFTPLILLDISIIHYKKKVPKNELFDEALNFLAPV